MSKVETATVAAPVLANGVRGGRTQAAMVVVLAALGQGAKGIAELATDLKNAGLAAGKDGYERDARLAIDRSRLKGWKDVLVRSSLKVFSIPDDGHRAAAAAYAAAMLAGKDEVAAIKAGDDARKAVLAKAKG